MRLFEGDSHINEYDSKIILLQLELKNKVMDQMLIYLIHSLRLSVASKVCNFLPAVSLFVKVV